MKELFLLFILLVFSFLGLKSQDNLNAQEHEILNSRGEIIIAFAKQANINELTRLMSIDKVTKDSIYAYCNKSQFIQFKKLNYAYRILPAAGEMNPPIMAPSIQSFITNNWNAYPTYLQYDSIMHYLANTYPQICSYVEIGTLTSGRKIMALKISDSVNIQEKEARFLYTSSMHGDEVTGYVLMLRLADYLLSNYGTNPKVTNLINNLEIWINPLANPDGTYKGGNNTIALATRGNNNNVDVNRNFPDPSAGQHPDGKVWQQETLLFMKLADSLQFTMSANFHGGVEVLNYPWDTWAKLTADDNWWQFVCNGYADTVQSIAANGYFASSEFPTGITNGYAWYQVFGGRQDYMNYFHRCRELTIELTITKMPQASSLPSYWDYNYKSLLNYMQACLYGLHGTVADSISGIPLQAKIFINNWDKDSSHVFSSKLGDYHRLLYQGNYSITYSAPGYKSKTISITIVNDSAMVEDVQLVKLNNSIAEFVKLDNILFYPIPTNKTLNILNSSNIPVKKAKLYGIDGRLLMEFNENLNKINVSHLQSGIYLINIEFENGLGGFKTFIKE